MSVDDLMHYMLEFFNNTTKHLKDRWDDLSYIDTQLSELDHYLEIHKLKSYEHAKLSKLRQELRCERRNIKNDIDMITTIKKFTDKYNNKLITGDIIQNLKEQELLKEKQNNPTFTYKTDILERLGISNEQTDS